MILSTYRDPSGVLEARHPSTWEPSTTENGGVQFANRRAPHGAITISLIPTQLAGDHRPHRLEDFSSTMQERVIDDHTTSQIWTGQSGTTLVMVSYYFLTGAAGKEAAEANAILDSLVFAPEPPAPPSPPLKSSWLKRVFGSW